MDLVLMVGAWAAALMAVAGFGRLLWRAFVKAVDTVISTSMSRIWRDMDDIENRLTALEASILFVREQLEELRRMMQTHIEDR
jgi:F0F1-type ATP synthase membrane subunit b/b'